MTKKQFSSEQIVAVLKQAELGMLVADLIRQTGISEQTFYRWKKQYEQQCLTVVDDFTKEAIDIVLDHDISGLYVARALDLAARFRVYPKAVRTDQGPEFTSRVLDQQAYGRGVTLKLIQAGKPTRNAYIESFNGKFRDECLNEHWFTSLAQARVVIAAWRQEYNDGRPHSSLGYLTPNRFAKGFSTADSISISD